MGAATDLYNDIEIKMEAKFPLWDVSQWTGKWTSDPGQKENTQAFLVIPEVDDFTWSKGAEVGLITNVLLSKAISQGNTAAMLLDEAFGLMFWITGQAAQFAGQQGAIVPRAITSVEIVDTYENIAIDAVCYLVQFVIPVVLSSDYEPPGEGEFFDFQEFNPDVSSPLPGMRVNI